MIETLNRIWSLVVKEFRQLRRDKILVAFVILGPLVELVLMGTMIGGGVENLGLAVIDLDRSRASRELVARLDQTDELLVKVYGDSVQQARQWMQQGEISAIIVVPPRYGEELVDARQGAEVQVIVDDSNYVVATVATSTVEKGAAEIVRDLTARYASVHSGPIDLRFAARFNDALDDRPQTITAMLGMIVYQVTLIIAAQSFTRERELGTLDQLRITPLRRTELIIGKAIPTLIVGLVDGLLMVGVIALWFDVPVRGSLPLLMLLTVPFVLAQVGWGTLISLISRTQQQAVLFVFVLAMLEVACSGFIVSASDMPVLMQVISSASSVQHYLIILRGVMLRGAGLATLWMPALALSGIAFVAAALAWARLRLGLDAGSLRHQLRALWRVCRRWWQRRGTGGQRGKKRSKRRRKRDWSGEPA